MNFSDLFRDIRHRFAAHGLETPDLDARFLMEDILHVTSSDLIASDREVSKSQLAQIEDAVIRRLAGEPVSRIAGHREFYGRRFFLSEDTLDPRPDTETLIEAVLSRQWQAPRILDLGTGTGCILLTLLLELPESTGLGIDLSENAVLTAQKNLNAHDLGSRAAIRQGDWLTNVEGRFDIIVSNPPYIPSKVIPTLSAEVQNHDPILALDGGDDGLAPYKFLLPVLKKFLEPHGLVFFEVGAGQMPDIARLAADAGATLIHSHRDLGGVERVAEISYGDK